MKLFILPLLAVMLAAGPVLADAVSDGNAAFAAGDYTAAARAYETALAAGSKSAGLYFNLASAQLKNGQKADAAVNLRRAILLDPQMIDARMALSELEKSQGVVARPGWEEQVAEKAPLKVVVIAGCVLAWIGAFVLLIGMFKRGKRAVPVFASLLLVAVGGGLIVVGYLADPLIREAKSGVVSAEAGASLLAAPADQSAVIVKLPTCAPVKILRQSGEWAYCESADGTKGWTSAKAVTPVLPAT
jgi:tetratricopeptide (TPR) repeat protein